MGRDKETDQTMEDEPTRTEEPTELENPDPEGPMDTRELEPRREDLRGYVTTRIHRSQND